LGFKVGLKSRNFEAQRMKIGKRDRMESGRVYRNRRFD
jgi:hypothetical protein